MARQPVKLPEFKGWTVDIRLGEFRKVTWNHKNQTPAMKTIPFRTDRGSKMLDEYLTQ